jgi:stage III sporulation protein AD
MIIKIGIMAIVGVILISLMKNSGSSYAVLVQIGVVCVVLISVIPHIRDLLLSVNSIGSMDSVSTDSIGIMMKIFAVLTVGTLCSDVCRDNGESAIADTVELSSRIIAIGCAVPVISSVVSVAVSFLKG